MNVGTHIDDSCVTEFNSLKIGHQHRFVVYKLDDKTNTVLQLSLYRLLLT